MALGSENLRGQSHPHSLHPQVLTPYGDAPVSIQVPSPEIDTDFGIKPKSMDGCTAIAANTSCSKRSGRWSSRLPARICRTNLLTVRRQLLLPVFLPRFALFGLQARFLIQFDEAVYEVVIAGDAGQFPGKPASKLQNRIERELYDPLVQRVTQAYHQDKGAEDSRLVLGGSAGCGVQRFHELFKGVEIQDEDF